MCDPLVVRRGEEKFDPPNLQLGREMAPIVVSAMREWRDTCGLYYPPYQHSGGTRGFSFRTLDSSRTSSSASALQSAIFLSGHRYDGRGGECKTGQCRPSVVRSRDGIDCEENQLTPE